MFTSENNLEVALIQAVGKRGMCTVIQGGAGYEIPPNSNSIVRYSRGHMTAKVLQAALPVFDWAYGRQSSVTAAYPRFYQKRFRTRDLKFSSNFVQVFGAAVESMHIHSTTIVVQIVAGCGALLHEDENGEEIRTVVKEGDMAVIPVGAPHFFHGDPFVVYVGIEFGPVIDYQKHY